MWPKWGTVSEFVCVCGETEEYPRKICQSSQSYPKFEWSLLNACLEHCWYTSLLIVHGQFSPLL